MKDLARTLITIIGVAITFFMISYLLILGLIFVSWLGGAM